MAIEPNGSLDAVSDETAVSNIPDVFISDDEDDIQVIAA
tara:strand:- start:1608 stop:1724 length:117 start_codon:yes stop_codon:yes gene_type:complete